MKNPILRSACLIPTALILAAAECQPAKDAFLFTNDTSAPNVVLVGNRFNLKFGVLSAAEGPISKPIRVRFDYWQINPLSPDSDNPSGKCTQANLGTDAGCPTEQRIREVEVTTPALAPGETWFHTLPVGEDGADRECSTTYKCFGTATIQYTNGGNNTRQMKVTWTKDQKGNPEALTVVCCQPSKK